MPEKNSIRKFRKNDSRLSDYGAKDGVRKPEKKDDSRKKTHRHFLDHYYTQRDDDD